MQKLCVYLFIKVSESFIIIDASRAGKFKYVILKSVNWGIASYVIEVLIVIM